VTVPPTTEVPVTAVTVPPTEVVPTTQVPVTAVTVPLTPAVSPSVLAFTGARTNELIVLGLGLTGLGLILLVGSYRRARFASAA
jgi:hypothetical protein